MIGGRDLVGTREIAPMTRPVSIDCANGSGRCGGGLRSDHVVLLLKRR